ncbi:MAG: hypothetical protein VW891_05565, partial [Novosphingobium sp.]
TGIAGVAGDAGVAGVAGVKGIAQTAGIAGVVETSAPMAVWNDMASFTVFLERGVLDEMKLRPDMREQLNRLRMPPGPKSQVLMLDLANMSNTTARVQVLKALRDILDGAIAVDVGPGAYTGMVGMDNPDACEPPHSKGSVVWYTTTPEQRNQVKVDSMRMPTAPSLGASLGAGLDLGADTGAGADGDGHRARRAFERAGEFSFSPLRLLEHGLEPYYDRGYYIIDTEAGRGWYKLEWPPAVYAENDLDTASVTFVRINPRPGEFPLEDPDRVLQEASSYEPPVPPLD